MTGARPIASLAAAALLLGVSRLSIYRRPLAERIADVILATVIGICLAAALVHFWSS